MHALKDNGVLCEMERGGNFSYILGKNAYFVNTDYRVLQSQTDGMFIPCMKMLYNGKAELYYVTDNCCSLASMLTGIAPDMLATVLLNLLADIIAVRSNGFLKCQNLEIVWDKVFVDPATLKVKLVYLPINVKLFDSYSAFESELRSNVVKLLTRMFTAPGGKLELFAEDLRNGSLTLEEIYGRLKGIGIQSFEKKPPEEPEELSGSLRLVAANLPEYFEILVDREELVIGKKAELVDAVIPFNRLISRKHCRIVRKNGSFYIADEGSANGTYVNQKRLAKGQMCLIAKGDVIRLANSEFRVE